MPAASPTRSAALTFALVIMGGTAGAQAATLVPHRAIYDLTMARADRSSGFSKVNGRMAIEISGSACSGWSVNFRLANEFYQSEGDTRLLDSRSTSWESGDGLEMRFNQKEYVDNALQSETRIEAKKADTAAPPTGSITGTDGKDFVLPAGTVFPMVHQIRLLAAAEAGRNRDVTTVFDGSDGDKVFRAISFIGKRRAPGGVADDIANPKAAGLKSLASWPVSISYYQSGAGAAEDSAGTPNYQVSFTMYDNGVSTGLSMDYGDFALKGTLAGLEFLPQEKCP
ncbi:MAG TPA: cell envelope integrity EipB family protein [Aestuariivirga sp.]|nr:cell envelope integrity EipB family protein [Aestuariivirga sp.]